MSTARHLALLAAALLAWPAAGEEQTRLELDTAKVTGNRELPRVMAIVPWKKAPAGELPGRPVQSLLDEALAPADRLVMRRQAEQWAAVETARRTEFSGTSGGRRADSIEEE
jgi:predicted secreted Zn-dependent protease